MKSLSEKIKQDLKNGNKEFQDNFGKLNEAIQASREVQSQLSFYIWHSFIGEIKRDKEKYMQSPDEDSKKRFEYYRWKYAFEASDGLVIECEEQDGSKFYLELDILGVNLSLLARLSPSVNSPSEGYIVKITRAAADIAFQELKDNWSNKKMICIYQYSSGCWISELDISDPQAPFMDITVCTYRAKIECLEKLDLKMKPCFPLQSVKDIPHHHRLKDLVKVNQFDL